MAFGSSFHRYSCLALSVGLLSLAPAAPTLAQTFEIVHAFTKDKPVTGNWPAWAPTELASGEGGRLYGATRYGGGGCSGYSLSDTCGVVFEIDPASGTIRVIHELGHTVWEQEVRLSSIGTGEIYGTESNNPSLGRLFKLTPTADGPWQQTVLHTFGTGTWNAGAYQWNYDGRHPGGPVMLGSDGRLYGTTIAGGGLSNHQAEGSLYRIWPDGSGYESLHAFHRDDRLPSGIVGLNPMGALVTGVDGHIYGTAFNGGSTDPWYPGYGTIFRYRSDTGDVEKLFSFDTAVAYAPRAGLVRGPGGALYGTTASAGFPQSGTVFRMTAGPEPGASASVTILRAFERPQEANMPLRELVLAADGFLYGAAYGGVNSKGVVFRIRPDGTGYEHVHDFSGTDGAAPASALVVGSDNSLYGTTMEGGPGEGGVVYRIRISPPQATIEELIARIDGLIDDGTLKRGQGKSLVGKLELALNMLGWGNTKKAITMLEAFIHEVRAFRNAGILDEPLADELIAIAQAAIASLAG